MFRAILLADKSFPQRRDDVRSTAKDARARMRGRGDEPLRLEQESSSTPRVVASYNNDTYLLTLVKSSSKSN